MSNPEKELILRIDPLGSRIRLDVVKDGPVTENTAMYIYPFSNVNGFSLCMRIWTQ